MSGLKPFKPGQSGNPGGKTAEQRRLEIENAEKATKIRNRLLSALADDLDGMDADALKAIEPNVLRLLKDSEDRGLGQPEQLVDHSSSDGSMTPKSATVELVAVIPDDFESTDRTADKDS